jgi:hypothetical protein
MSKRQADSAFLDMYPVAKDIEKQKGFLTKMAKAVLGLKKGGSVTYKDKFNKKYGVMGGKASVIDKKHLF